MKDKRYKPISLRSTIVFFLLCLLSLLTISAIGAYYVAPQITTIFQWLGIFLPFLIILNFLGLIVGLAMRKVFVVLPILTLIASSYYYPLVFQFEKPFVDVDAALTFATYNVRGFNMNYNIQSSSEIANLVRHQDVKVLFLQEIPYNYTKEQLSKDFSFMKYILISESTGFDKLAILSMYPIQPDGALSLMGRSTYALFAQADINNKKIALINCHLHTTGYNQIGESIANIKTSIFTDFNILSNNLIYKEQQVNQIREKLDRITIPKILAGDFNDSPVSYTYYQLKKGLNDAFKEAGSGYGYTYRYLKKAYRIDYILFSEDQFTAHNYSTAKVDFSDHLPVFTDLTIK